ncbi:MAG: chorismate synthase, partial [Deltaproteobacteria bacterium]|nr:chorismate synthase [Deltaproteobacteria bacterium]
MLRYLTAGESHGKAVSALLEGMPSGLKLDIKALNADMSRRQGGYGRGGRQAIERDVVDITAGVRFATTLGSPIMINVINRDWENWHERMSVEGSSSKRGELVTRPRPGHADLAGAMKYAEGDVRNILERSSARETAARVAVGGVCKELLRAFGIDVFSWVIGVGGVSSKTSLLDSKKSASELFKAAEISALRCPSKAATSKMKKAVDMAKAKGDSLGGLFEVAVTGTPPGLGSHVQWDRKLDARLTMALMSVQAIKSVEVGLGRDVSSTPGSRVHDEISFKGTSSSSCKGKAEYWPSAKHFMRKTNNAGGIEGGMTNGEPIILRAAMKPIPTLYKPLKSVDIRTKKSFLATIERSDICAVPAASVVGEA